MAAKVEKKDVIISQLEKVIIDRRTRSWCKLPYPNHPYGCPNYGKRETCPPKTPLFKEIVEPPFVLIGVKFNLEEHVERMKKKHPDWTDRQARCVLYWQGRVNKQLKEICERTASDIPNAVTVYNPEGMGVHMFETCKEIGLVLERNPQKIVWKIAIMGIKKA